MCFYGIGIKNYYKKLRYPFSLKYNLIILWVMKLMVKIMNL